MRAHTLRAERQDENKKKHIEKRLFSVQKIYIIKTPVRGTEEGIISLFVCSFVSLSLARVVLLRSIRQSFPSFTSFLCLSNRDNTISVETESLHGRVKLLLLLLLLLPRGRVCL